LQRKASTENAFTPKNSFRAKKKNIKKQLLVVKFYDFN